MTFVSAKTPPTTDSSSSASSPSISSSMPPLLQTANSHLAMLTQVLEAHSPGQLSADDSSQPAILLRLKTDLVAAMNTYRIACQENAPLEAQLMRETDLLWHCNQCDYYLSETLSQSKDPPLLASSHNRPSRHKLVRDRGLWQIRRVYGAVLRFKLLTHVRQLMPGPNTLSLSWREILSGFRLWM